MSDPVTIQYTIETPVMQDKSIEVIALIGQIIEKYPDLDYAATSAIAAWFSNRYGRP